MGIIMAVDIDIADRGSIFSLKLYIAVRAALTIILTSQ